jgi:regulator of replication initiation timing
MSGQLQSLSDNVELLQHNLLGFKNDVKSLKEDVKTLQAENASLKEEIATLKRSLNETNETISHAPSTKKAKELPKDLKEAINSKLNILDLTKYHNLKISCKRMKIILTSRRTLEFPLVIT